ncbi:hypothetical protein BT93_L4342 [Corymbia citriodora subsp. variegata]|uniref:Uncharacterized protein n=1 Tax=Corymbia citriodora subsp. variegata TaxID=360336 RepID=A0A8T0CUB0_CORYI|nr:hypothetical protein BT93_L4342 [Corymbia citriodora subsp. variegata]
MDSVASKAFLLVQLLLLLSCFQEASGFFPDLPVPPPAHPQIKPLAPPPAANNRPSHIVVQGVVYCKSCIDTLTGAKPISGAVVKVLCTNNKDSVSANATTDMNGYFFLQVPLTVASFVFHKCNASLVSSPIPSCSQPSNLNGGSTGVSVQWAKPSSIKLPFILYSVGPFAFEPKCRAPGTK